MVEKRINTTDAQNLLEQYIPMFKALKDNNIKYCLVGGIAVMAHALAHNYDKFRATVDADLVLPKDYSNLDFAKTYVSTYSKSNEENKIIAQALVGNEDLTKLNNKDLKFSNLSFIGAQKNLDGIDTPDFDVCRIINGYTIEDINTETIKIGDADIVVASIDNLIAMKERTIKLYGADPETNPRFQDFIDLKILKDLKNKE